ncbi:MAG: hypothetical protein PVF95_09040 [bacterium]
MPDSTADPGGPSKYRQSSLILVPLRLRMRKVKVPCSILRKSLPATSV